MQLSPAQVSAIEHVRRRALEGQTVACERIAAVLARSSIDSHPADLLTTPDHRGQIALNFHPDRIAGDGRVVATALLDDGIYRSQFETHISNGGLTAFPGGDRDGWERDLFGDSYHRAGVTADERPKYGGLNLMAHPDGPCPRFGSCHLVLHAEVEARATFCFGDSFGSPADVGTSDVFEMIVAATLESVEATGEVLGRSTNVSDLIDHLLQDASTDGGPGRALDDYIETQVHGTVDLAHDALRIVADPSFRGTALERTIEAIARRYDLDLAWHQGFELDAADVPAEFRGPAVPVVARRVAHEFGDRSRHLNAETIGRAARSVARDAGRWADLGTTAETLQHIKQLWHVLVAYGHPSTN